MATIERLEDLDIWKEARLLSKEIIQLSKNTELKTDYKLNDQIKGASASVMEHIAERFERDGNLEFRQFLSIAKGSAGESRSQLYRFFDSEYISEEELSSLVDRYLNLSKRIANFIIYLNKNEFKGNKFK